MPPVVKFVELLGGVFGVPVPCVVLDAAGVPDVLELLNSSVSVLPVLSPPLAVSPPLPPSDELAAAGDVAIV